MGIGMGKFTVLGMVLILDGNSEMLRTCKGKQGFRKKNQFATAVDLRKYLTQIKLTISLHTCPPFNTITVELGESYFPTHDSHSYFPPPPLYVKVYRS